MAEESKTINAIINSNSNNSKNKSNSISIELQQNQVNPMFHDFLGMKPSDSPLGFPSKANDVVKVAEASPSVSASVGASSGGGGGGRGPISSTSDLGSVEKQAGNHLEGVPFYGPRSDISGSEISNRLLRSKRTNSDSVFMGHESLESLHLMKIMRNGAGGERSRRSNDGETLPGVQHLRPSSAALILQPPAGSRSDINVSKWERSIPMNAGPAVQYPPRGGQIMPYMHQIPSNRFKDINASTSVISQTAADEGSRTGIKGPGLLSSMNTGGGVSEKSSYGVLPCRSRPKSGAHIMEPESSIPPNHQGLTSASRQMTIFYGGQAHVFDDVHPNKADVIMSLAGSNGGSWSTIYSPKPNVKPVNEIYVAGRESEGTETINAAFPREFRARLSATGNSSLGAGTCDRTMTPTGIPQGIVTIAKEGRNVVQAGHPGNDEKREV